jgi:23S rRNA (adenine2503-C2)-methyltransferase
MKHLLGHNLAELKYIASLFGLPSFTGGQIADWLYKKKVKNVDDMTNLSKSAREKISSEYDVGRLDYADVIASVDGTKKYLFSTESGGVETVMIPDEERFTICVSSQAGCKMGCRFCMTGRQGFHGNLSSREIISQFMSIDESLSLTNAVFMGMGEPLDNYDEVLRTIEILTSDWGFGWSSKRITLSTIGVLPQLKNFLDQSTCHLAVSLHNPFPEQRLSMMPIQKGYNIEEVVSLIRQYDFSGQRRVSFEYIMFDRINDSKRHADELLKLLRGIECRINLIRFHKIPDSDYAPSPTAVIERFKQRLNDGGIVTTLRASRGEDILAACGMLAGKKKQ